MKSFTVRVYICYYFIIFMKSSLILTLMLIFIIFISGCTQSPLYKAVSSQATGQSACTTTPCCGNEICETGETYLNCQLDCPYRNEKYGFSIKIPKGWTLTEKEEIGSPIEIGQFTSADRGALIMLMYMYKGVSSTTTLDEVIQSIKEGSSNTGSVESEEKRTINDIPVYIVEIIYSKTNLKQKMACFLPKDSGIFMFGYGGQTDTAYRNHMNDFIESINSFQLIK